MGVNIGDRRVGEQLPNGRIGFTGTGQKGIRHHASIVETTQRQSPASKNRWNRLDIFAGLVGAFPHENGMRCPVRIGDVMADMIEQEHSAARRHVFERHAAGEAGMVRHCHADDIAQPQFLVGQAEKVAERLRAKPADSIGHAALLGLASNSRVPDLALKRAVRKMRVMNLTFHADDLDSPDVLELLDLHFAGMRASSPPEACHVLPIDGLRDPALTFWAAREDGELVGVGALKELEPGHGEVKSMRTSPKHLGRGVGGAILAHIMSEARRRGYTRVSLETGSTAEFAGALRLYQREGFQPCGPFGGYPESPFTRFFTQEL